MRWAQWVTYKNGRKKWTGGVSNVRVPGQPEDAQEKRISAWTR